MKVLMTCGGTGGHINPAIAVANRIKTISPGAEIAFVGTEKGMEASLVPKAGYPIRFVKVRGFKRKLTLANIDAAVKAVTSVVAAKRSSAISRQTWSSVPAATSLADRQGRRQAGRADSDSGAERVPGRDAAHACEIRRQNLRQLRRKP
ncbi:MAG: glycosyltransferase [Acutalibacteraceae bacterium]